MHAWCAHVLAGLIVVGLAGCLGVDGQEDPAQGPGDANHASPTDQSGPARGPVTWKIDIKAAAFVDGTITIQPGDTVQWTNRDLVAHTVTADNGDFNSGPMPAAPIVDTFAFTFEDVGKYPYHCQMHGAMDATITVLEPFDALP